MKQPPEPLTPKQRDALLASAVVLTVHALKHPLPIPRVDPAPPTKEDYRP